MLHDNLKTAVLSRTADGTIHWQPRYLDFARYYGFSPRPCRPYRAQTKGKVENGVKYVRGNFWLGLEFNDLTDLNDQVWNWLDDVANVRCHGTTGEVPFVRLAHEGLQPLAGKPDYDTSLVCHRRSTKDCLVSYEGNRYSVPAAYAQQQLLLKETEGGQLLIYSLDGRELARHAVLTGHRRQSIVAAHYQGLPSDLPAEGVVLMQVAVETKENELVAAPRLLSSLDLRGRVVSGDALFHPAQSVSRYSRSGG